MKKILTSTLILTAVSNAFAADTTPYVCETTAIYSSCSKGYYLADGAGAYSEIDGTRCDPCPSGAYCPGGTEAPVYTVTIDINGFDMGFCAGDIEGCEMPKLYRSASAHTYCMVREKCTSAGKDDNDTLAEEGYIDDPSWVPALLKNSVEYGYYLENNSVANPVLISTDPDAGEYEAYLEFPRHPSTMAEPEYPGHMTVYVNVVNKVSFDPGEGEYTNPNGIADKIMYKNMPLEALTRDDTAKRQGYTFAGWYTEDGRAIYDSNGMTATTGTYDASYNTLYAHYILSFCESGFYPKGNACTPCPEYKGHSASSDSETTSITQCYISDSVSWSFTDDMGTGTMKFTEDCYAQE